MTKFTSFFFAATFVILVGGSWANMAHAEYTKTQIDYPELIPPHVPEIEFVVNRSNYTMSIYQDGELMERRKVIVGRPGRATPLVEAEISHIELNPIWDVPHSLTDDMVRKFKRKSDRLAYIKRNGYHFYDKADGSEIPADEIDWVNISNSNPYEFIIKQDPGPYNMLGQVMFVLKGTGGVQMHGTANPELFDKEVRRFSSGCIRVDQADDLAAQLLGKSDDEYSKMVATIGNKWIRLSNPVKVKVVE